jgi:membrane-associated phospholipid phosphatase
VHATRWPLVVAAAVALLRPACATAQLRPDDRWFWTAAAVALAGTAATDADLRASLRGPGSAAERGVSDVVEPLGRAQVGLAGLAVSYATARLAGQPAWTRATVRVAAGYLAADVVTAVLKPAVNRARPPAELGPHAFHAAAARDHHHAFPSGHATHAFALAAGIAEEADRPWVAVVAYGTAALVGWSRVHDDAHWASDVVAGAVVGVSASLTTVGWLERRERRRRGEVPGARGAGMDPGPERTRSSLRIAPGSVAVSIRF